MSAHTPGPWEVGDDIANSWIIQPAGACMDPWIADVKGTHVGPKSDGEVQANAHLIAAAPDLLAALAGIAECVGDGADNKDMDDWCAQARAAIAKARGEPA